MGRTPLSQSIKIQKLAKSPFLNVNLVWKDGFRHGSQNKVVIETTYIPHACVSEFLQGERGDMQTMVKWNISKNLSPQQDVKKLMTKNYLGHTWYGFKTCKPFHWSFLEVIRLVIFVFVDLIECKLCFVGMNVVMGLKTTAKTPTTWGKSNTVVCPIFPSKGYTHSQMWWKSFFTISFILEPMEILFMVHVTQGPHHKCWHMFHMCLTSWKSLYGPN